MPSGNPPDDRLYTLSDEDLSDACTHSSDLTLQDISVTGLPSTVKTFTIEISAGNYEKELRTLTVLKGPQQEWLGINIKIESKTTNCVRFKLVEKKACFCIGYHTTLGEFTYILTLLTDTCGSSSGERSSEVNQTFNFAHGINVNFRGIQHPPVRGPCWLFLNSGMYASVIVSDASEQLWGPMSLPYHKPGVENNCQMALHRLMKQNLQRVFIVRIIHSLPLQCSVIHVFYHDKVCAVAHSIGDDQIPKSPLVKCPEKRLTKNVRTRERAVLIKNKHGDWAVIKGRWTGNSKGTTGTGRKGGRRDVPVPVPVSMQVYKMSTGCWQDIAGYVRQKYTVTCTFESLFMDLKQGYLQVNETSTEIVEYIALAFSISLLHVLCRPRPPGCKPDDCGQNRNLYREAGSVQAVPSNEMMFIEASGSTLTFRGHTLLNSGERDCET